MEHRNHAPQGATRKRKRARKRNHGYENQATQALTLHDRAMQARGLTRAAKASRARRNSTLPIGNTVRTRSMSTRIGERARGVRAQDLALDYEPNPRPRRKKAARKKAVTRRTRSNVEHVPTTTRGRKGNKRWYILDLFDSRDRVISTRIKHGTHAAYAREAASLVGRRVQHHIVRKVELSGPYAFKPSAASARK